MGTLYKDLVEARLLRRLMFQALIFALLFLAAIKLVMAYDQYAEYRDAVEACVEEKIGYASEALAKILKLGATEQLSVRLNSIEFSCAYPDNVIAKHQSTYMAVEQANFFWSVIKNDEEVSRIGKNLLPGPVVTSVYPLSIWSDGNQGDYWVGSIHLETFYGDFVAQLSGQKWRTFGQEVLKLASIWSITYLWFFLYYVRPNRSFVRSVSEGKVQSSVVRNMLVRRSDELSDVWRSFLLVKENADVERFELEAQIRELEAHISKIERGQVGQSLSTEHASLDIKNGLSRTLVQHVKAARAGDSQAEFNCNYIRAISSVAANLHERAQMESGELILCELQFNLKALLIQVYHEFKPRIEQHKIEFYIELDPELPEYVVGDPEKIKRIIRNAFKRALLEPSVDVMRYRANYSVEERTGPRFVFDLVARGRPKEGKGEVTPDRKEPEKGPTPMLEMLCYIMSARWVFSQGLDGELKQSLNLAMPVVREAPTKGLELNDYENLANLNVLVYDVPAQGHSSIYKEISRYNENAEYCNSLSRLREVGSQRGGFNPSDYDLLVVSDIADNVSSREFVAELRRNFSQNTDIVVVSENPLVGDGQVYKDVGVQGFISRSKFEKLGMRLLNYLLQYKALKGRSPQLVTRYSLLDYYGVNEDLSLPKDILPKAYGSVLLIAEELVCIEFTRLHCAHYGARFVHFSSSFDAIDAFRRERYDLVLVDDQFDDIDSITLISMLRDSELRKPRETSIPIIALGSAEVDDKDIYLRAGASDVINKYTIDGALSRIFDRFLKKRL